MAQKMLPRWHRHPLYLQALQTGPLEAAGRLCERLLGRPEQLHQLLWQHPDRDLLQLLRHLLSPRPEGRWSCLQLFHQLLRHQTAERCCECQVWSPELHRQLWVQHLCCWEGSLQGEQLQYSEALLLEWHLPWEQKQAHPLGLCRAARLSSHVAREYQSSGGAAASWCN